MPWPPPSGPQPQVLSSSGPQGLWRMRPPSQPSAVAAPFGDFGAGTDTLLVTMAVSLSDTGTGSDVLGLSAVLAFTDAGTAIDSESLLGQLDRGGGTDVLAVVVVVAFAESGASLAVFDITVALGYVIGNLLTVPGAAAAAFPAARAPFAQAGTVPLPDTAWPPQGTFPGATTYPGPQTFPGAGAGTGGPPAYVIGGG